MAPKCDVTVDFKCKQKDYRRCQKNLQEQQYHTIYLLRILTPDMWVIHTGLVIGQSDEGCVSGPVVNEVQQNLVVVDSQVVHVL